MEGRWQNAPLSLTRALKKFEETLGSIYDYLKTSADTKWTARLLNKGSIERALADYNASVDDAARSFQIATLINIHYAVGDKAGTVEHKNDQSAERQSMPPGSTHTIMGVEHTVSSPVSSVGFLPRVTDESRQNSVTSDDFVLVSDPDQSAVLARNSTDVLDPDTTAAEDMEAALDDRGFRRYHQSDLVLRRSSHIKQGWWAGATEANVDGRHALVMRYEGPRGVAMKRWIRDVKLLQNVYHPNLPQMIGYSGQECPTPFILLANVQTRLPQALVLDSIKHANIASCVRLIMRFYKDTLDAALYLHSQMSLSDSKIQDYVENATFRIDAEQTLIMGLPPPEVNAWQSWRNYGLAHSIRGIYLKLLPNHGYATEPYDPAGITDDFEWQQKINHLSLLLNALLPSLADAQVVSDRMKLLLNEDEEKYGRAQSSLRQLRLAAFKSKSHEQVWRQKLAPAFKYAVGDLAYVPEGESVASFRVLRNIFQDELGCMDVVHNAHGNQFSWETGAANRQELHAFPSLDGRYGWPIVLPTGTSQNVQVVHDLHVASAGQAWHYLLENGKRLAECHSVKPENLILVTRAGNDQRFVVRSTDYNHLRSPPGFGRPPLQQRFGNSAFQPPFGNTHARGLMMQPTPPTIMYLFTSGDVNKPPLWSDTPICGVQDEHLTSRTKCLISVDGPYGFFDYVQLHAEDFAA